MTHNATLLDALYTGYLCVLVMSVFNNTFIWVVIVLLVLFVLWIAALAWANRHHKTITNNLDEEEIENE